MIAPPFLARLERFPTVGSTNDVVRDWLSNGTQEVCIAVADEQSAGRGRAGRTWAAPKGRALLLSAGFRPSWLDPGLVWRLAAVTSLAMAASAEEVADVPPGTIRLKWPNDLVVERGDEIRKLAGVLGETEDLGTADPRAVVGIGINGNWRPSEFPEAIAASMTSLRDIAGDRAVDHERLLDSFTRHLETAIGELRLGTFDADTWQARQLTNGRRVRIEHADRRSEVVRAVRVDPDSGALCVAEIDGPGGERAVFSGEIHHLRVVETV
jgi:BirA family biotin operon repressor/biotin-[acetyl-CoA-carboxylase] ligase